MKKLLYALLALLLLTALGANALAEGNLIKNGDFSEMDGENPRHWRREMWYTDAGISLLSVDPDGYEGNSVCVNNVDVNDARFAQTVSVEPNSIYRISGMVYAENCDTDGYGATISIGNIFVYSESRYDTEGLWDYIELYGRTGKDQTELDVFCRVGGYGTLARGKAWFDNIEMVKLDAPPADGMVYDFFKEDSGFSSDNTTKDEGEPERFTEAWLLFTFAWLLCAAAAIRKRERGEMAEGKWGLRAAAILGAAMVVRLITAARVPGYYTDINCFTGWSQHMLEVGPLRFYGPNYFCDYPPGYILLLLPVACIRGLFNMATNTAGYRVLLKLLPMLVDAAGAWVVWRYARRRLSERAALLLCAFYAFNPAAIANSAAWGQIDSILTLLVVLCALQASEYHYVRSLVLFAAALLIKPQALLFGPLGLTAMLAGIVAAEDPETRKARLRDFIIGAAACLGILYAFAFVFSMGQGAGNSFVRPVTWMVNLYSGTMQGYRYMTVNTLNLHELLQLNWARVTDHPAVCGIAWVLFGLSYVYTAVLCFINRKPPRRLLLLGGVLILLITAFGPMMHERYVFPAMLLLTLAYVFERDRRVLISLLALTATLFLNEVLVLQGGMTAANYGHLQSGEDWLNCALSLVVVANAAFAAWTAFDICVRGRVKPLRAVEKEAVPAGLYTLREPANYRLNLRRADYLLMAAVTLAYSVLTFVNLGDTRAPQSGWTSSVSGESVVFDLGDVETYRMTYYGGICNSNFTVALSNDGQNWTEEVFAKYNQGEIFRWLWFTPMDDADSILYGDTLNPGDGSAFINYATGADQFPMQTSRFVRITAQSAGLNLFEVGFLDGEGSALPIKGVDQFGQTPESNSPAARLVDEQATVAAYPSYLNSTYFDEIYHARTAYEQLHGMNVYEWTHPPLGKVWMMLGVKIFGMTPFGWRFMGALVGVLMLPVMYLLVKQLTKDTKLSAIAMGLLALDSMHFTQTRIATIDSYAVFWIMVMYLFMIRYSQMSFNREPLRRTLVPLGLCGVTMGIAWATKWIGIYASVGLAVIFFWTLYRRLREAPHAPDAGLVWKRAGITLLFCVLFFIIIPILIYYFSYYWHLRGEGLSGFGGMFSLARVRRVIQIQQNIYNYHAGLGGDTHYFRSPWYQWPVIWWPMWYYSGTTYMPEGMISSISCMGNPAVWWFGLVAMVYVYLRVSLDRRASRSAVLTAIGFASQFLPWVIVPRSTFIYHYFASVPFIIMASVLLLNDVRRRSPRVFAIASCTLLALSAALFGMFYPLESGLPCAKAYARHLRWFKWYNY